jgi:histidyl-tRNA synthetase
MSNIIRNIKGTKDILPDESNVWQYIEDKIHSFFKIYGYSEVRTPAFENTALFKRSIGEETDIVSKEMYNWIDQGGNNLTLKPEVTASVARLFIQHNLGKINPINKLYYIDSLFRRERPQKGRFRQFQQFGVEALGSKYPEQDAEVIALIYNFYQYIGLKKITLKINSIGSKETRNKYKEQLYQYLLPFKNDLTTVSQTRLKNNPLRILDTKIDFEKNIIKDAPHIIDCLNDEDKLHFDAVLHYLDLLKISYTIDHKLVRGLDYYSRTVFEIQSSELGAQDALCGGGRYDYLIKDLGGESTPAFGFAAGLERLIIALNLSNEKLKDIPDIYIISIGDNAINLSVQLSNELRLNEKLIIHTDTLRRSLKAQMKEANKLKAKYTIIIGDDEIQNKQVTIKNMKDGQQDSIHLNNIKSYFNNTK